MRIQSMEIRRVRISHRAIGLTQRAACLFIPLVAVASEFVVPARAGDEVARAARKDSGASPAFVDRLIEEGWKKAGVKPAETASDAEFLRRIYVDMLGRIPNVQEA